MVEVVDLSLCGEDSILLTALARGAARLPGSVPTACKQWASWEHVLAQMLIVITSTNIPVTGSAGYCRFRGGLGT